jgi:hypothetical protein
MTRPPPPDDDETVTVPLPTFRRPPGTDDPHQPTVPSPAPSSASTTTGPSEPVPDGDEPGPPDPMPDPSDRTGTYSGSRSRRGGAGDPRQAARMVAGLLAIVATTAAAVLYRRGRLLRQPTPRQLDDISSPLGRLLVRYLPLEVVGATLVDVTEAAAASHAYALDGPLVEPVPVAPTLDDLGDPAL